jgi:hypothetical protein
MGHELLEKGVDPLELMELDETARRLRALPARAWPAAGANARAGSHEPRRGHAHTRLQRSGVGELL